MAASNQMNEPIKKRHKSYLRQCCPGKDCEEDIYKLHDRIEMIEFEPMFGGFIHHDKEGEVVTSFPYSRKFSEYLYDFCNYNAAEWKRERYITSEEVSVLGRGKIMILWRVLDKYGGRYDSRGYTRNIVDVQIMIPSLNLHALEHFCYRYMSRRTGEPQVVVPRLLRQGLARLYNRFFVFEGEVFKPLQISFRCTPSKCDHKDEDAVPDPLKNMIPPWFYSRTYPADTSAVMVSVM